LSRFHIDLHSFTFSGALFPYRGASKRFLAELALPNDTGMVRNGASESPDRSIRKLLAFIPAVNPTRIGDMPNSNFAFALVARRASLFRRN